MGEAPSASSGAGAVQAAPAVAAAAPDASGPLVLMGEKELAVRRLLTAIHAQIVEKAENVGKGFAEEALKIHHGESDSRPIYGEATREEARRLEEEGVEFMALPALPEARN